MPELASPLPVDPPYPIVDLDPSLSSSPGKSPLTSFSLLRLPDCEKIIGNASTESMLDGNRLHGSAFPPATTSPPISQTDFAVPHEPQTRNQPKLPMQRLFAHLTFIFACAALALGGISTASAEDKAASATGTWTWTSPGRNGGAERKVTLTLQQDGEKLTGKLSSPGRDGAAARETEIADGSVKGADVAFSVTREFNGNKRTSNYTGKLSGDTITGKMTMKDQDGNDQSRDWTAKKEAK
jgi:hypothetical protein